MIGPVLAFQWGPVMIISVVPSAYSRCSSASARQLPFHGGVCQPQTFGVFIA